MAGRLANTVRSVRFRLTATYSLLLFALAAAVIGAVYVGLARTLDDEPVSRTYVVDHPFITPDGRQAVARETVQAQFQSLEEVINRRALDQLRDYSFIALGGLFVASLLMGWLVAGRVLAPIGHITDVARDIQATDLSRRISLDGPKDELRDLADTFDGMLGRLEDAFEAQRTFVHEASHELRNPLAVMRTNLEVAAADPKASVDDLRRTNAVVQRTVDRMNRLVDDLLAYAREGLPERVRERIELGRIVDETIDEFALPAAERRVELARDMNGSVSVLGDRTALKQAMVNLVDNAVRLAPEGSTVTLGAGERDGWAYLAVIDEGPGIAAEHHGDVFERFWRAAGQPAGDGARSGLGLAIVRQIAEHHGGRVGLSSAEGSGSTFVVWLPPDRA